MRDKKKEATFSGNVKVVQGDTTMTSKALVVFYGLGSPSAKAKAAKSAPMRVSNSRAWRKFVDPSAGSEGQRRRGAKGSGRDRRKRDF